MVVESVQGLAERTYSNPEANDKEMQATGNNFERVHVGPSWLLGILGND